MIGSVSLEWGKAGEEEEEASRHSLGSVEMEPSWKPKWSLRHITFKVSPGHIKTQ